MSAQQLSVEAPFGTWPMDKSLTDISTFQPLFISSDRSFGILQNTYFIKLVPDRASLIAHELRMMILAGDCSVTPLGRVFDGTVLSGLITPYEKPVTVSSGWFDMQVVPPELTRSERMELIDEMCALVSRLHAKNMIHGDVKPSNLLRCSDGSLRFCDFAESSVGDNSAPPRGFTLPYASPVLLNAYSRPLTKAEDLYSLGISIWEVYTGRVPFVEIDEDDAEDLIRSGGRPDLSLVDDPDVLVLITRCLDSGKEPESTAAVA